jgi:Na+/H+ antiporter NhaD/arsenite permease-like protein
MNLLLRRLALSAGLIALQAVPAVASSGEAVAVNPLWIIPFVTLLLAIAVAPFINRHWWEKHYPVVALGLGALVAGYYVFGLQNTDRLIHTAYEYVSFICLIGSLFVVAGGIHIKIRGRSTPIANVSLLGIGAVIANIVGTTGASMILIRPFLRVNRYRIHPYHVVFFIIIVSNMGGALTPIGDPPLFLGYLNGVGFFWVAEALWGKWLIAMGLVLAVFFVVDTVAYRRLPARVRHEAQETGEEGEVTGLSNIAFLAIILIAVFITRPIFVREILMAGAAAASYFTTKKEIHAKNGFNFAPINEVAFLFAGIFATMIPALDWLEMNAGSLGIRTAGQFYWATGVLSSFLDNAPTYLNFLHAELGLLVPDGTIEQVRQVLASGVGAMGATAAAHGPAIQTTLATLLEYHIDGVMTGEVRDVEILTAYIMGNYPVYLQAISLAAVFFGAMTYIGNGPNFMVKSIAEQSGVKCPSFFGFMVRYSIPVLLPIFLIIWYFFFRG